MSQPAANRPVDRSVASPSGEVASPPRTPSVPARARKRSPAQRAFLGFLGAVAVLYLGLVTYHLAVPQVRDAGPRENANLLEQCRQLCQSYGLLPTGHLALDAEAYLTAVKSQRLTDDLQTILADETFSVAETQFHPLLEQPAPSFSLKDHTGKERSSSEWTGRGPVVLVFYYGYGCSHCVAQLFALDKDLALFRELGADIVAVSSDSPEHTTEKYKEYGEFKFPVLSDPDNRVAQTYGTFTPKTEEKPEKLYHGTFVIDAKGQVIWASFGNEPFLDNKSLLHILAKSQGIAGRDEKKSAEAKQ